MSDIFVGKTYVIVSLSGHQHGTDYESMFVGKKMQIRKDGAFFFVDPGERDEIESHAFLKSSGKDWNNNGSN